MCWQEDLGTGGIPVSRAPRVWKRQAAPAVSAATSSSTNF